MTYLRIVKNKPTMVTFDRTFLEDKRLGLAERGLLAWLLQQTNGTRLHVKDLKQQLPDTKAHIDAALLALRCARYILSIPVSQNLQVTYTEYHVYERPQVTYSPNHISVQHITLVDDNKQPVGKDPDIDLPQPLQTITKKLSLAQTIFIDQAARDLHQRSAHQTTAHHWQKALRVATLDKTLFPTLHPEFFKKLNALKASAMAGDWFPYSHNTQQPPSTNVTHLPPNTKSSTESPTCQPTT